MENYIWGLDISTTNIGCALFNSKGKLIELKHLELKIDKNIKVEDRYIHKSEIFKNYVIEYKKHVETELNGKITNVIIEQPLGGSNNSNTVALLYGFNGICSYIIYEQFKLIPLKISVHDCRKLFLVDLVKTSYKKGEKVETLSFPNEYKEKKKLYIWERVAKLEPQIKWFYKKDSTEPKDINFDMSDSFVVCIAGLLTLGFITSEDWKKRYLSVL